VMYFLKLNQYTQAHELNADVNFTKWHRHSTHTTEIMVRNFTPIWFYRSEGCAQLGWKRPRRRICITAALQASQHQDGSPICFGFQ
jgi:hypothetical protein